MIGDNSLGQSLADGIDLRGVTSTLDSDADVNLGEGLLAEDEEGLEDLQAKRLGLGELDGGAVKLNQTISGLAEGDSGGSLFCDQKSARTE